MEKRGPPLEPPCTAHVVCSITGVSSTCTTADRMPEVTEGPQAWPKTPKPTTVTASPAGERRRVKLGSPPCLTGLQHPNPSLPFTNSNPSLPFELLLRCFCLHENFPRISTELPALDLLEYFSAPGCSPAFIPLLDWGPF